MMSIFVVDLSFQPFAANAFKPSGDVLQSKIRPNYRQQIANQPEGNYSGRRAAAPRSEGQTTEGNCTAFRLENEAALEVNVLRKLIFLLAYC